MNWLGDFHFLRPAWLLLLVAVPFLWWLFRRGAGGLKAWRRVCDPHLLQYLSTGQGSGGSRGALALLLSAWVLVSLALAGPVWQKRPLPLFKGVQSRVVVLDLSRSMLAADLSPNRLEQARFKLADLLDRVDEGQVALVAYAGEAFIVSPLTQDANTIKSMLGALDPGIMPVQGSELDEALVLARQLLDRAARGSGQVIVMTDSAGVGGIEAARELRQAGYNVSVLGVGTADGAPIPARNGGFYKAGDGSIVVPRLDEKSLRALAEAGGGLYARMSTGAGDLDAIFSVATVDPDQSESTEEESLQWREEGPWLVLLLLPLAALAFRRGWLAACLVILLLPPESAQALSWNELWNTPDQQASRALADGETARAAQLAEDPMLRGEALYRQGDYRSAARAFGALDSADAHYNRGNALARQNRLEDAIAAYEQALERAPGMEDAEYNKSLLEELLKQQEQQQQQQDQDQQSQDGEQSDSQEQQSDQQQESGEESQESQASEEGQQGDQQEGEPQQGEEQQAEGERERQVAEELSSEERQAVEQWLRRIPDDPGGLLRRKFLLEYQRRGSPEPATEEDW